MMPNCKFWLLVLIISASGNFAFESSNEPKAWTGKWFPFDPNSYITTTERNNARVPMGVINPKCDDAKSNLTLDWNNSFYDYVCTNPRNRFVPDKTVDSLIRFDNIPKSYQAAHFCMDREITYDKKLPTFGPHRPLWPVYGEYKFLPKQRWLHSLEHGAIVALYHPCADLRQIKLLKELVKSCLRRHVITPSTDLPPERPLGLLAWGVAYTMSTIYPNAVRQFIKEKALHGPEAVATDGQYDHLLIQQAATVSDYQDSNLCPV